jgi:hypothetical protein
MRSLHRTLPIAPATSLRAVPLRPAQPAWIIGRRADLACLIGGALVSYALLGAHLLLGVAAVTIYVIWVLTVDGPHVFATLSRTYLDAEERAARARLLRWSLAFFALGPASVGLSALAGTRLPYWVFLTFCSAWAYWHVVRQHYGVMVLYKRKAGDTERADDRVDSAFLYAGLLAPFASFVLSNPGSLALLGMDTRPAWAAPATVSAWSIAAVALAALAARQIARARRGLTLNRTKLAFLAAAVSVSAVLFSPPIAARIQYEVAVPIVTSFHNVQYLAIVWFFHQNRYQAARRRRRPVPPFVRRLWIFLGAGLLFTVGYRVVLGCMFSAWPGCDVGAHEVALPAGLTVSDLGVGFMWGFALHHYYLDQRIWHVRHDPSVSRDLRLDEAAAVPRPSRG